MAQPARKSFPIWLIVLGIVLVLAAALAFILRPQQQVPSTAPGGASSDDTGAELPRATLEEAKAAYDSGSAVFVDVRGPAAFDAGHIPGSLLIPLNEFEAHLDELDKQDWILLYCT